MTKKMDDRLKQEVESYNALNKEKVQLESKVAGISKEMLKIVGKIELLQDLAEKEINKKDKE